MNRKLFALSGLASGGLAAVLAYRRWFGDARGRIDVYFADGSFVTSVEGSKEAERLLPLAREVLAAARET